MKEEGKNGLSGPGESTNPSRRGFVAGATLGVALASAGIYEVIDKLVTPPERAVAESDKPLPPEQYAIPQSRLIMDDGTGVASSTGTIPVLIPPLHNHVITATLKVPPTANALQEAQQHLESVIQGLEKRYPPLPAAWASLSPGDFPTSSATSPASEETPASSRRGHVTRPTCRLT
ncbi:twin-arginine translocation signal domain-containing protein [Streptomyces chiangmaiensis]